MSSPDSICLVKHEHALVPLDDEVIDWLGRKGDGELLVFDRPKVKDRDPIKHRKMMRLFRTGWENQPDPDICEAIGVRYYDDYNEFRKAWTREAGFVTTSVGVDGTVHIEVRSLSFNDMKQWECDELRQAVAVKWARRFGADWTDAILMEVDKLAR